jgi:HEAT repeat protein
MQDDQLLQDLSDKHEYARELAEKLRENEVTTYSQLFALMRDEKADSSQRVNCIWAVRYLASQLDKRRVVFPLLTALKSEDDMVRGAAAQALGSVENRRAVPALVALLDDTSQPERVRIDAALGLSTMRDQRSYPLVKRIMFDTKENVHVRSVTIEWLGSLAGDNAINNYMELLSDSKADIRFWAAYGLSQTCIDKSDVLEKLDAVVAYDHNVPEYWGWHVDREAINALEQLYYARFGACSLEYG